MINDSGNRTKFESGAVRDIQEGKGRCDLLPLTVIGCWCEDSAYDILGCIDLYRLRPSTEGMSAILNKFASKHRNTVDTCKGLERYRWELVLEVAKHFEDGAKKYGDRNWEKGIPCDRYIDSAVRHYCKWRACWTDEPHDRAFIWNILCCEWTRQRYGWNLERLEKKPESKLHNNVQNSLHLSDGAEFTMTVDGDFTGLAKVLDIKPVKEKDQETAELKEACAIIEHDNACFNAPAEVCWGKTCKECEHYIDPDITHRAINQLLDHAKKSLGNTEAK